MRVLRLLSERRGAILAAAAALAAGGIWVGSRLPLAIFPSVTFPVVKVIADVGEEPAARMMPGVTRPLEEALLRVPGIRLVRSTTSRGSTEISANFAWGTEMTTALQRVQAETARVRPDLPAETRIDVEWMNTAVFPILGYALTSDTRGPSDLWELAEYGLKPELVRIPGVSQVQIQGGRRREFQVHLDPEALAARKLAATDVLSAIRKNNQILSAGMTESNHELYLALVDGRAQNSDAIGRIPVPVGTGLPALVSELGTVTVADAVSYIRTTADGRPAVLVNVIRQPSANTVAIAEEISRLFARRPDLLPRDVRWTTFYDQAGYVSQSVRGVRDAILIGVGLAAIVLFVFLRSLRLTLVAAAAIPTTVAIVLLALGAAGQTINLMTLGGIAAAIGLIADDAIVVAESIQRHREEGAARPEASGLKTILPALAASTISTIVIFLPFAFLTGVTGAFFQPLALTMALALAISFFVSAAAVPAVLPARSAEARPAGISPRPALSAGRIGLRAAAAGLVCLALLGGAALLVGGLGSDFLPAMDEGSIILDYWTPPGTSLTDTDAMLGDLERQISNIPDVRGYSRRTGTQLGFFITEPNSGDYVIRLKPRGERRGVEEVIADIRARAAATLPALHTDFGQLLEDNIADLTGGAPQPIDLKIFGEDQASLQARAREAAAILRKVPGVADVFDGIVIAGPALTIRVPPDRPDDAGTAARRAARFGLTTEDVRDAVEPAVVGTVAGEVRIGERLYDLRVFAGAPLGLPALRIRTPSGALVPLTEVAAIRTGAPEAEIDRENLKTFLGVTGRLDGRDLGSAVAEIRARLERGLRLPAGMRVDFGGLYEQQESSFRELFAVLVGGLALVAIVLLFAFGDWRAPVLTAVISLAVLAGAFGALFLTGMTLNVSSFVGAIMLVGIAGENAIFVIHEARAALRRGEAVPEAWRLAAKRRRRPVVMTILASAFALAPLALSLGEGSQLQQPLAIAVIGGFLLSGPLVLWVLPSLYAAIDPRGRLAGRPAP
ncbi:MAG TPA: efflux RND transporter permease subunit [Thermoanaerobaculia bacterium]